MDEDVTYGEGETTNEAQPLPNQELPETEAQKAHVEQWVSRIRKAKKHHGPAFKQMRECMQFAAHGATKEWIDGNNYVVPIISRHINLAVAQLYAKNPTTIVKRRRRRMYEVWDGRPESLQQAQMAMQSGDVSAMAIASSLMQDIEAVAQYNTMMDGIAETMEILWQHTLDEQTLSTKKQLKALVRRTKTNGVGYVKLGIQREYEPIADGESKLDDSTDQMSMIEDFDQLLAEDEIQPDDPKIAEVDSMRQALQQSNLVQEGLYFTYPKSTRVIIDPGCTDLSTLSGANWIAYEIMMTAEQIQSHYKTKVAPWVKVAAEAMGTISDEGKEEGAIPVYEIWCKRTRTVLVVCEGHKGYVKAPDVPPVAVEGFYNLIPLVFNDIESETELFPPSDVWRAKCMQEEYNRSREGLREHRIAARPYYVTGANVEDSDLEKLQEHAAHEIISLRGLPDGAKPADYVSRGPTAPLDPNLYEVENINQDILRTVGAQEANLGGLSGGTATESSIAESSRMSGVSDQVDDLDMFLEAMARMGSAILLTEMSQEKVVEIVGPGAVWPQSPQTLQEIASDVMLGFEAGSSGRPNKAQDIASLERSAGLLVQMPGVQPGPIVRRYADLLDLDPSELYVSGSPSIVALNGAATGPAPALGGEPAAQGPAGGAEGTPEDPVGAQPAFPAPTEGLETLT